MQIGRIEKKCFASFVEHANVFSADPEFTLFTLKGGFHFSCNSRTNKRMLYFAYANSFFAYSLPIPSGRLVVQTS